MENNHPIEEAVLVDKVLIVEDAEVMAFDTLSEVPAEIDLNDEGPVYASVEEIPLTDGTLYIACKIGVTLNVETLPENLIKVTIIGPDPPTLQEATVTEHVFGETFVGVSEYWTADMCLSVSAFADVEFEQRTGNGLEGAVSPGMSRRVPPGYRKARNVGSQSEIDCILRCAANSKSKTRSKNKAAKKSRAKNRK